MAADLRSGRCGFRQVGVPRAACGALRGAQNCGVRAVCCPTLHREVRRRRARVRGAASPLPGRPHACLCPRPGPAAADPAPSGAGPWRATDRRAGTGAGCVWAPVARWAALWGLFLTAQLLGRSSTCPTCRTRSCRPASGSGSACDASALSAAWQLVPRRAGTLAAGAPAPSLCSVLWPRDRRFAAGVLTRPRRQVLGVRHGQLRLAQLQAAGGEAGGPDRECGEPRCCPATWPPSPAARARSQAHAARRGGSCWVVQVQEYADKEVVVVAAAYSVHRFVDLRGASVCRDQFLRLTMVRSCRVSQSPFPARVSCPSAHL